MTRRPGEWVLLSYRIPREPSTPRITVWRKLERLGVARLGDGLVALPADARTREQLEWLAEEIVEADGTATVWLARPASTAQEDAIVDSMRAARAAEYRAIIEQTKGPAPRVAKLRAELRRIDRRDFFPPPERDVAHAATEAARNEIDANPQANTGVGKR
ncbi:MAG TPA: Chromate resistance protein ChrB [Jiangellaceae bacterium]